MQGSLPHTPVPQCGRAMRLLRPSGPPSRAGFPCEEQCTIAPEDAEADCCLVESPPWAWHSLRWPVTLKPNRLEALRSTLAPICTWNARGRQAQMAFVPDLSLAPSIHFRRLMLCSWRERFWPVERFVRLQESRLAAFKSSSFAILRTTNTNTTTWPPVWSRRRCRVLFPATPTDSQSRRCMHLELRINLFTRLRPVWAR